MNTNDLKDISEAINFIADTSFTLSIVFLFLGFCFGYLLRDLNEMKDEFKMLKRGNNDT
jgi:hypothetical protein